MTPHNPAATWTWTGNRDLPDWIGHHHWHADRPVIQTADGPRTLYDGWMAILWTDGAITVASATVAERVYGPDGIAGRLKRAEAATDGELRRQLAAAIASLGKSETELAAFRAAILDIDAHATPIGLADANDPDGNPHHYAVTVGALHRALGKIGHTAAPCTAEAAVARVQALADQWVKAGPPPLGTPTARWWDKRLVELNAALNEEQFGPA